MNWKFYPCLCLLISTLSALAADLGQVPLPTVTPPAAPAPADTNAPTAPPKTLGGVVTNSAGGLLIKISENLWAGKYDVTQKEYQKIMGFNPSAFEGLMHPVDSVSWKDAMDFCAALMQSDAKAFKIPTGFYYTLPTEEEWDTLVADASLDDAVTSLNGDRNGTSPVGSTKPNGLGLCDMRGNVAQWTLGDDSKPYRVLRGGSWQDSIEINLRTIFRIYQPPDTRGSTFGFRVVLKKK